MHTKILLEEKTAKLNTDVRKTNELKEWVRLSEQRVNHLQEELKDLLLQHEGVNKFSKFAYKF